MPTQEDVQFARLVLKLGWLSKETLETALREIDVVRQHDPDLACSEYFGVKEILPWDRIEQVTVHLKKAGAGAGAAPARPAGRRPGAAGRRMPAHQVAQERPAFRVKRRQNSTTVILVVLCVLAVALIGAVVHLTSQGSARDTQGAGKATAGSTAGGSPTAETVALEWVSSASGARERLQRADDFLSRYPASPLTGEVKELRRQAMAELESEARRQWASVKEACEAHFRANEYANAVDRCRLFAERYAETAAAREATDYVAVIDDAWKGASEQELKAVTALAADGKYVEALYKAYELGAWCHASLRAVLAQRTQEYEERRDAALEVARANQEGAARRAGSLREPRANPGEGTWDDCPDDPPDDPTADPGGDPVPDPAAVEPSDDSPADPPDDPPAGQGSTSDEDNGLFPPIGEEEIPD